MLDIIQFYGYSQHTYHLYTDSQAAEHIATQPTMNEHSRSIDIRHHALRQDYLDNMMRIGGVKSKDNTADILTKFLQPDLHREHTRYLFPNGLPLTPSLHPHSHVGHTNAREEPSNTQHTTANHGSSDTHNKPINLSINATRLRRNASDAFTMPHRDPHSRSLLNNRI